MKEKLKKLVEEMASMSMTTAALGTPPVKAVGEPVDATPPKKKKKIEVSEIE